MRIWIAPAITILSFTACYASAQQLAVKLHNFKPLPPGLYQQTGQAYREGKPFGEPVTDQHCAAPSSPETAGLIQQMQGSIAPNCSKKATVDTATEAEVEQVCDPGAMQTVIHSTMKRVDENTVTTETNMTKAGQQLTSLHSTLRYLGACPAGMAPPSIPKPSAEDCAGLPEMREQAKAATVESCRSADFPPAYIARCEASMKMLKEHMQLLENACK